MAYLMQTTPKTVASKNTVAKANFGSRISAGFAPKQAKLSATRAQRVQVSASYNKVTPVGSRVVVKIQKAESTSAGGILLPESAQDKPTAGAVVSVGSVQEMSVGDNVVYSKFAGTDIDIQDEPHLLLKEDDVIGKMDEDVSKLQPFSDRVLIEISKAEETTTGGLLLTESSKEKPSYGNVVAVGPGRKEGDKKVKVEVSVGATVMFNKFSGVEFKGKDKDQFIVVREADILAILE